MQAHGLDVHVPAVAHDELRAQCADGRPRVVAARRGVFASGQVDDPLHVVRGLGEGRYGAVFQDVAEAGVVGGEGQLERVAGQSSGFLGRLDLRGEVAHVVALAPDRVVRVPDVGLAVAVAIQSVGGPCARHELGDALRAGARSGLRVPVGFLFDLRGDDARRDDLADGSGADHVGLVLGGHVRDAGGLAGAGAQERAHDGQKHAEHGDQRRDDRNDGKADGGGAGGDAGRGGAHEVHGSAGHARARGPDCLGPADGLGRRAAVAPDEPGGRVDAFDALAGGLEGQVACGGAQLRRGVVVRGGEPCGRLVHPVQAGGSDAFDAPACLFQAAADMPADHAARLALGGESADAGAGLRVGQYDRLAGVLPRVGDSFGPGRARLAFPQRPVQLSRGLFLGLVCGDHGPFGAGHDGAGPSGHMADGVRGRGTGGH